MNKHTTLSLFNDSVAGKKTGYKTLYECECPHLNRSLGFREQLKNNVLKDISKLYPTTESLVYVSQGPGGFLWDFIMINSLINTGYQKLEIVFIEPLYEKKIAILQAYLDFQTWYKELAHAYPTDISIRTHLFKNFKEYEQACSTQPHLKGQVLLTIDPDDNKTIPNFDSLYFRKKCTTVLKKTMQAGTAFYYLYFQNIHSHNYRHYIAGRWLPWNKKNLLCVRHEYGVENLQEKSVNHIFLNTTEILPFELKKDCVQIGKKIICSPFLQELLRDPLKKPAL